MEKIINMIREQAVKNKGYLIRLIQDSVRIKSYSGEPEEMQRFLLEKMESLGMETRLIKVDPEKLRKYKGFSDDGFPYDNRYSLTGVKKGTGGPGKSLILNGHVDVVPPGDLSRWEDDPLSGRFDGARIYGRGALDMKAGLSAAVTAVKILQEIGFENCGDIIISSVCGEETGGCGAFAAVEDGLTADGCIILEPTKLNICHIQSGCHTFKLTIRGRAIHACMAYKGINAIDKFYLLYEALKEMDRRRHEQFSSPYYENRFNVAPLNIGKVSAGDWPSSVPDLLEAHGRMGIFPGEDVEEMHRVFEDAIKAAARGDSWLSENMPEIEWYEGLFESAETDIESGLVRALAESHTEMLKRGAQFEGATYGSDMRIFNLYGKIPTVLYGPGDVSIAHTVNEYIDVDTVVEAVQAVTLMIYRWCRGACTDVT